jgi:hypothetical protein
MDVGMDLAGEVNLAAIWKLSVTLAHRKIELGKQEKRNLNTDREFLFPEFLFSLFVALTTKKPCAEKSHG